MNEISYAQYVAENVNNIISYDQYVMESVNNSINYGEYLVESINKRYFYLDFYILYNKSYKLNDRELIKLKIYIYKVVNESDNYFYFMNKDNYLCKIEDDYYVLFYNGIYNKCDQLSGLIKEIRKINKW